jgi:hypothetical protein
MSPLQLRRLVWTAWLAVFGFACAPTLSGLLAAGQGAAWGAVCSSTVEAAASPSGVPDVDHTLGHCPLCGLASHGGWLPAVMPALPTLALGHVLRAEASSQGLAWHPVAVRSRGPPASSGSSVA